MAGRSALDLAAGVPGGLRAGRKNSRQKRREVYRLDRWLGKLEAALQHSKNISYGADLWPSYHLEDDSICYPARWGSLGASRV